MLISRGNFFVIHKDIKRSASKTSGPPISSCFQLTILNSGRLDNHKQYCHVVITKIDFLPNTIVFTLWQNTLYIYIFFLLT